MNFLSNFFMDDTTAQLGKEAVAVQPQKSTTETQKKEESGDHVHQRELVMKSYVAPRRSVDANLDKTTLDRALFGATILLWRCLVCSETMQQELLGTDENQLDSMLDKVDLYGSQYFQRDGITYVIAKYVPPAASTAPGFVPLR